MYKNVFKILSLAGVVGVAFYLLHVIIGGLLWSGYNPIDQAISDLTATGAPYRSVLLLLLNVYSLLLLLFIVALINYCKKYSNKLLLIGSILFLFMHLFSFSYTFFPEDLPGSTMSFQGVMHLVVTAFIVPLTISSPLIIGIGFIKHGLSRSMGVYSIISSILIFISGGITAYLFINKLPYFGLFERLNIGTLQIWTIVLSLFLFNEYKRDNL